MTMRELRDLLISQEQRDVRLAPRSVVIAITDLSPQNAKNVTETLQKNGIKATVFIQTRYVGLSGITEKMILTMMGNGLDVQSGTHMGDDLRGLTNAQVELELNQSRKMIEDITAKAVFAVTYPEGGVNERVIQYAAQGGYLVGIASEDSIHASPSFTRADLLGIPAFLATSTSTADDVLNFVRK